MRGTVDEQRNKMPHHTIARALKKDDFDGVEQALGFAGEELL
jgi:2'-5' RNA ligase